MRHTQYPDPGAIVYAKTMPPPFPCQQTTRDAGKSFPIHNHGAWLSKEGDGNTDVDSGHFHRVRGFKVLPDESDGHTHQLTMLPCGAGGARTVGRDGQLIPIGTQVNVPDGQYRLNSLMGVSSPSRKWLWWGLGAVVVTGAIVGGIMLYQHHHGGE